MAFTSLDEVAVRLGHESAAALTAAQTAQVTLLIELATGLIAHAVDRDDAWAIALSPVPAAVRAATLEAVVRGMQNPSGASSESETLGAYTYTRRYEGSAGSQGGVLGITKAEARACRRAVWGVSSGSIAMYSFTAAAEDEELI